MRRFVGRQVMFEPSAHTLCLCGFARGRDHFDLLDVSEIVEALGRQSIGEVAQIFLDEQSRFEAPTLVRIGIIAVVVPIEAGLPRLLHDFEQVLFGFVEHVETHHGVAIHIGRQGTALFRERIDHPPVECTLIGLAFGQQLRIETAVERQESIPQSAKAFAQFALVVGIKVGKETPDEFFLLVVEKAHVIQLFEFLKVAKQLRGVGHVFVHIVEVGQDAVGPAVEGVERKFVGRGIARAAQEIHVVGVEPTHTVDGIVERYVREFAKKLADRHITRCPQRGVVGGVVHQVVIEKQTGAAVGEDHHHAAQIGEVGAQILRDVL